MNNSQVEGKWKQVKGEIQKMWGKLTDDDIEKTKGNAQSLAGVIQEKFGDAKDNVSKKIDELYSRHQFNPSNDYKTPETKDKIN